MKMIIIKPIKTYNDWPNIMHQYQRFISKNYVKFIFKKKNELDWLVIRFSLYKSDVYKNKHVLEMQISEMHPFNFSCWKQTNLLDVFMITKLIKIECYLYKKACLFYLMLVISAFFKISFALILGAHRSHLLAATGSGECIRSGELLAERCAQVSRCRVTQPLPIIRRRCAVGSLAKPLLTDLSGGAARRPNSW